MVNDYPSFLAQVATSQMQEEYRKLLAGLQKTGCQRGKKKNLKYPLVFRCFVLYFLNSCQHNLSGISLAVFRFNNINFEFICVVSLSFSFPTLREHNNLFYLIHVAISLLYLFCEIFSSFLIFVFLALKMWNKCFELQN